MKDAGWENDGISWAAESSPLSHMGKKGCTEVEGVFLIIILFGSFQLEVGVSWKLQSHETGEP